MYIYGSTPFFEEFLLVMFVWICNVCHLFGGCLGVFVSVCFLSLCLFLAVYLFVFWCFFCVWTRVPLRVFGLSLLLLSYPYCCWKCYRISGAGHLGVPGVLAYLCNSDVMYGINR